MDRARAVCPWTPSLGGTDRSVCSPHYGSVKRLRIFEYLTSLSFQLRPHLSHFNLTENFVTRERQDGDDDDDDDDDDDVGDDDDGDGDDDMTMRMTTTLRRRCDVAAKTLRRCDDDADDYDD